MACSTDNFIIRKYLSPCGELLLGSFGDRLCLCDWTSSHRHSLNVTKTKRALNSEPSEGSSAVIDSAISMLDGYFAGLVRVLTIPILTIGTDFQKSVWQSLLEIGYGETMSYRGFAIKIGNPKAIRAVANALGANPLSIFLPCHRITGSNGSLTGYAGGIVAKRYLLSLESTSINTALSQ